ncbi:MAG: hypothetical protein S4CHLAM45_13620 [Chlamydiales bacterium]|nr:hypothetical protein [Chlamydiales bacterium]MCH9620466.1 hypothetical protein [Chlamydiales bacterium]MCH9623452.1 hypothetical protein [Chlamydiales bacterium]
MSPKRFILFLALAVVTTLAYFNWPKETPFVKPPEGVSYEMAIEPIEVVEVSSASTEAKSEKLFPRSDESELPEEVDRLSQLFQPFPPLPSIVETISYTGRVPWVEGRSAYLGDYALRYKTSKHFISRSLNGMGKYLSDTVSKGNRFNVLRTDKEIEFHLILDLSRLKLWAYAHDVTEEEHLLLKSFPVCAGQLSSDAPSGCLTPTGTFLLGDEIAVYKEGMSGTRYGRSIEMVSVFGTRWIPLSREIANCTGSCKGLGIQGVPWKRDSESGEIYEDRSCIGTYQSEGCIRLLTEDIEELFAVIVSRPTYIHIVADFVDASLSRL